jgi:D-proline reductase (dithiol) PrdB
MTEPVAYIEKTRRYYEAQGFSQSYQYAAYDSAPFTALKKPLADSRVGLVTTASTYFRADLEPRKVNTGGTASLPEQLFTDDLSWDKAATHTNDVNSFCPITSLHSLVDRGVVGSFADRFVCAPTEYSQRATIEHDAPEILAMLQADEVDVALLVPL